MSLANQTRAEILHITYSYKSDHGLSREVIGNIGKNEPQSMTYLDLNY